MASLREQLRNNTVALFSFIVAVSSLGYNTWRNEHTEHNRTIRAAAFEMFTKLADFERVVFLAQYDHDKNNGNPRIGWTDVIVIQDLAEVMPDDVPDRARNLQNVWRENWEGLGKGDEVAVDRIDDAITQLRNSTRHALHSLR